MISWIIKPSCLCYLPQPSASADNTDLGFDNSWYHAQPHPIIVYCCCFALRARWRSTGLHTSLGRILQTTGILLSVPTTTRATTTTRYSRTTATSGTPYRATWGTTRGTSRTSARATVGMYHVHDISTSTRVILLQCIVLCAWYFSVHSES